MSRDGWREVVLGDFIKHKKGFAFKSKNYTNYGIPIIKVRNFTSSSIDMNDCDYVSLDSKNDYVNYLLKENDVIIATVGSWLTNPNSVVGKTVRVPNNIGEAFLNQNAVILRSFNDLDQVFLFYLLKQDKFKYYIVGTAQGSANQASITLNDIFGYPFQLPPLPTQKAIAKILGDLDVKIELNRKMNESLEAMAQALFQSWFVDFDPALDNFLAKNGGSVEALPEPLRKNGVLRFAIAKKNTPEINELFPDSFVFNEVLGKWIPEGWGDVKLNEVAEVKYGKDHKKLPEGKFPCYGSGGVMRYVDSTLYENHSVLIPRKGTLSNLMYIRNPFWSVDTMFYTTFKEASHVKFIYYNLKRLNLSEMNVGSAVPSMTTVVLNDLKFVFPNEKNIKRFDFELEDLYLKIESNKSQTQALTKLRDTLLPQLISGKMSVPDAMLEVVNSIK